MSDNTINVRELVEQAEKEGLLVERAQFVREASIRIYSNSRTNISTSFAWLEAKALWNAKPEDC